MAYNSLRSWPIFNFLDSNFVSNIRTVFVFGQFGNNAFITTNDSKVYGLGTNDAGCLGIGTETSVTIPQEITVLRGTSIKKFACGLGPHVLALTNNGTVYAWGSNEHLQLGTSIVKGRSIPFPLESPLADEFIVDIACGPYHSLALTDCGHVFFCGSTTVENKDKKGNGSEWKLLLHVKADKVVSIACTYFSSMFHTDSTMYTYTSNLTTKLQQNNIEKIVCGKEHTLGLTKYGVVLAWGNNKHGELGLGHFNSEEQAEKVKFPAGERILDIAAIYCNNISIAIDTKNQVYIWGQCRGQNIHTPTKCMASNLHEAMAYFGSYGVMHALLPVHMAYCDEELCLLHSLKVLFDDDGSSDIIIKVEGKDIHAHKAILKMRSPVFQTMFKESGTDINEYKIEDGLYSYDVCKTFLNYLYTDEIDIDDPMYACKLFELAVQYGVRKLKHCCMRIIKRQMDISHAVDLYRVVAEKNFEELEALCISFIVRHLAKNIHVPGLTELPDALIRKLFFKALNIAAFN